MAVKNMNVCLFILIYETWKFNRKNAFITYSISYLTENEKKFSFSFEILKFGNQNKQTDMQMILPPCC